MLKSKLFLKYPLHLVFMVSLLGAGFLFAGEAGSDTTPDNYLPVNFFKNQPPITGRDLLVYEELLELLADDTFEPSFLEQKLSKDYKIKPERIRYIAVKISIIVILEVSGNDEGVTRILTESYGPEVLPTENEIQLVKPRLNSLALALSKLTSSDVEELPYLHYLFKL
jgi:hypothetical protein